MVYFHYFRSINMYLQKIDQKLVNFSILVLFDSNRPGPRFVSLYQIVYR